MMISRFFLLSLAMAGCAAGYVLGHHTGHLEKRQLEDGLGTWENEGGNLAPSQAGSRARSAVVP